MNRYKRDWLWHDGKVMKINLYKNDAGEVYVAWEGGFERVYKRWSAKHQWDVWTFDNSDDWVVEKEEELK